jgi:hypothetical protein
MFGGYNLHDEAILLRNLTSENIKYKFELSVKLIFDEYFFRTSIKLILICSQNFRNMTPSNFQDIFFMNTFLQ